MTTLEEKYNKQQTQILSQLKSLKTSLKEHTKRFEKDKSNWGFLGDLNHITSVLNELDGFVKSNDSIIQP